MLWASGLWMTSFEKFGGSEVREAWSIMYSKLKACFLPRLEGNNAPNAPNRYCSQICNSKSNLERKNIEYKKW